MTICEYCRQSFPAHGEDLFCSRRCRTEFSRFIPPPFVEGRSLAERLEALSIPEPNSGCRLWLGGLNSRGYGHLRVNRKWRKAHQVAYELERGPIPPGKMICHTCDVQICIEGNHLYAGTAKTNHDDMVRRGRAFWQKGLKDVAGISVGPAS
jgi:hypothetical protein